MTIDLSGTGRKRWARIVFFVSMFAAFLITVSYRVHQQRVAQASLATSAAGAHGDRGLAGAGAQSGSPTTAAAPTSVPADPSASTPKMSTAKPVHDSFDPDEPGLPKRVHRAGSDLCTATASTVSRARATVPPIPEPNTSASAASATPRCSAKSSAAHHTSADN